MVHHHVSSLVAATNHHPNMPCPPLKFTRKTMLHHKNPIICSHFEGPTCVVLEKSQQTTTDTKHPATLNSASTRGLNPKSRKVTRKTMRLEKAIKKLTTPSSTGPNLNLSYHKATPTSRSFIVELRVPSLNLGI